MDAEKVIEKLRKKYPGKKIIKNDEVNPTEILCEVDPASKHSEYSLAVSVIDKSAPHSHKVTKETYRVKKGNLSLFKDGIRFDLREGEEMVIQPGEIHWAEGDETWVECYSEPGWVFKDHILEKQ